VRGARSNLHSFFNLRAVSKKGAVKFCRFAETSALQITDNSGEKMGKGGGLNQPTLRDVLSRTVRRECIVDALEPPRKTFQ
jgi:hypothetical protein